MFVIARHVNQAVVMLDPGVPDPVVVRLIQILPDAVRLRVQGVPGSPDLPITVRIGDFESIGLDTHVTLLGTENTGQSLARLAFDVPRHLRLFRNETLEKLRGT